jgi:hypothetical protein
MFDKIAKIWAEFHVNFILYWADNKKLNSTNKVVYAVKQI